MATWLNSWHIVIQGHRNRGARSPFCLEISMFWKQFGQKRSLYVAIRYGMTGKCLFERFLRCPFHYPKVPLETGAPPIFWCFLRPCCHSLLWLKFQQQSLWPERGAYTHESYALNRRDSSSFLQEYLRLFERWRHPSSISLRLYITPIDNTTLVIYINKVANKNMFDISMYLVTCKVLCSTALSIPFWKGEYLSQSNEWGVWRKRTWEEWV